MAISAHDADRKRQTADESDSTLQEALDGLLQFTGATAGWIGLLRPDGQLFFPARAGSFSDAWLALQQGPTSVWGFAVYEEPILLNRLPPLAILGKPALNNLLSCLLRKGNKPVGQLIVANKPNGFTSQDVTAVQTAAHLLSRQLLRQQEIVRRPLSVALLQQVLDQLPDGILVVGPTGRLVFANATWTRWTGYASEDLCDRSPPFPFWISPADLAALDDLQPALPELLGLVPASSLCSISGSAAQKGLLPFRHRNHSLFWCQVETTMVEIMGQVVTIAFLHRLPAAKSPTSPVGEARATVAPQAAAPLPDHTPAMALLLHPGECVDLWDARWEELTGLTRQDLAGVSGELFLDWLLPRQADRDFVADLFHQPQRRSTRVLLEVAGRKGNHQLFVTFLPVRTSGFRQEPWITRQRAPRTAVKLRPQTADAWLLWACSPTIARTP